MSSDETDQLEFRYSHTTVEWVEPRIWAHERDCQDHQDGRDIQPLDDPITHAIGREYAKSEELICIGTHIDAYLPIQEIDITVGVKT